MKLPNSGIAEIRVSGSMGPGGSGIISKTPVRLRRHGDLPRHGAGTRAYSSSRARSDIVSSSLKVPPAHRRRPESPFHQSRKKQAERKVRADRANLLRVGDIGEISHILAALEAAGRQGGTLWPIVRSNSGSERGPSILSRPDYIQLESASSKPPARRMSKPARASELRGATPRRSAPGAGAEADSGHPEQNWTSAVSAVAGIGIKDRWRSHAGAGDERRISSNTVSKCRRCEAGSDRSPLRSGQRLKPSWRDRRAKSALVDANRVHGVAGSARRGAPPEFSRGLKRA